MSDRLDQLSRDQRVDSFFVVTDCREATTKSGKPYWTLKLSDRTGTMAGRVWDPADAADGPLDVPGVFRVVGVVDAWRDELQLKVDRVEPFTPPDDAFDALVPASKWTGERLVEELRQHVSTTVRSDVLRRLLLHVMDHPEVAPRLGSAPAAVANHHAYRSGLAEHTLSMMRLATLIGTHYAHYYPGRIEPDLLVAGVLLHDLGKVWELEGDLATRYSTVGNLVGHIPMGAAFIARAAAELGDVPTSLVHELQHLILSHHGELAYGSPQTPKTLEAQLLHYIDQLDSKANLFVNAAGDAPGWSPFQRNLGRPVLQPSALRTEWAAPAVGSLGDRGPGQPIDAPSAAGRGATVKPGGRPARVRPAAEPDAVAAPAPKATPTPAPEPTVREVAAAPAPASTPEPTVREAAAAPDALAPTATLRETPAPPSRGADEPPPPTDDDAPGNLDLFDGLG